MSFEFTSISGGDGAGKIKERAWIVAKNAYATKATYGMCVQWKYDIDASSPYGTTGNGWDFVPIDGSDVTMVNNGGLAIGLVWPSLGIPAGGWGRILAFGEHPAGLVYSAATAPFVDLYVDTEVTGADMTTHVLRPWGNYLTTAARVGYMGALLVAGAETDITYSHYPGGYAVPIQGGTAIADAGTERVFCKFLG